ncbi:hypothetical protein cypCar_00046835 [Cyprinus carpio]|nr:hypothetical protein cypCar_00046835 [Cyprinus carpio]
MQSKKNIILHLAVLQLMIIISNVAITKSQGHWYCPPSANTSNCINSNSYVDCHGQNVSCKAYSCTPQSPGCSCMIGSYNCSSNCSYEASPKVCSCNADNCHCLNDMINSPNSLQKQTTAENIMNFVDQIANMTGLMSAEAAENYLKTVDDTQEKVSDLVRDEDKSKLVSYGNSYLNAFESLVSALVKPTETHNLLNISLDNTEVRVLAVGPNASEKNIPSVSTEKAIMDINIFEIAKSSPSGSAAVAFMSYKMIENLLKPDFFNTSNDTIKTMMSTVISATLLQTNNTKLTKPVIFTFRHIREFDPSGSLSCVYWNISAATLCSNLLLELLNSVCVIVGLVFFSLALLTFALCQWSPGVNNVARINICISLLQAHLLFLLRGKFLSLIRRQQTYHRSLQKDGSCWIKHDKGFIWSFLGPVCVILALNMILFIKIVITLNSTLKTLNAEVSQMKQSKVMVFKTLAQFVVLGCPWILGFFSNVSMVLEILFLILNSQQGTFIFLIYCVLNNEVRQQYRKFFRCLCCGRKKL